MTCFRLKNGQTIAEWCKQNGVNYDTAYKRLDSGKTVEEVCEYMLKGVKPGRDPILFVSDGNSLAEYCKQTGASYLKEWRKLKKRSVKK
jgi:hypothetical protein